MGMVHLNVRAVHAVPAFGMAVVVGAFVGALALGSTFILSSLSLGIAAGAFVSALVNGLAFGVTGGLVFFPVFIVLRAIRALNQWTMVSLGGLSLAVIGIVTQAAFPEFVALASIGVIAGLASFRTLYACAQRDAESPTSEQ